jgi:tRNA threonylcarbamoyladenosine biosynthesis protein TsaB
MNLIAIETSTEFLSLAVSRDGEIRARNLHAGQRHAEMALDELDALLREAGLALSEIGGIVFGAGPGSFTGLRIACGLAQGLALARGIPVLPVGSLSAVAETAQADKVVACLDARMGEVYHGAYLRHGLGEWKEVFAPGLYSPGKVPELPGEGWAGCGSGFGVHASALRARYAGQLVALNPEILPNASAMLRLAAPAFARGEGIDAAQAVPQYVRDKVALKTHER